MYDDDTITTMKSRPPSGIDVTIFTLVQHNIVCNSVVLYRLYNILQLVSFHLPFV